LQKSVVDPQTYTLIVQAYDGDKPVGQIEARTKDMDDGKFGYVNLFYLIPDYRGKGYGRQLEQYTAGQEAANERKMNALVLLLINIFDQPGAERI
jgi:GNAT superfamily N-acetyltransferase